MTIVSQMIAAMRAAGVPADQILVAVEAASLAEAAEKESKLAAKREATAERVRRHRALKKAEAAGEIRNACNALQRVQGEADPSPALDGRPLSPAPLTPPLNPSPTLFPPVCSDEQTAPEGAARASVPSRRSATVCPEDFEPVEEHFAKAATAGLDREWVLGVRDEMVRWSAANAHRQIARKVDWSLTFHGFLRREIAEELRRRAPERRDRGDPRPAPGRGNRALQIAFGAPLGGSAFGAAPAPSRPEFEDMIDVPANIHRLPSRRP